MASYFDVANEADLNYLPDWARKHSQLVWLAPIVEADVIAYYTRPITSDFDFYRVTESVYPTPIYRRAYETKGTREGVYLYGYKEDAADSAVDANLKVAMKRAIAEVLVWRIRQVNIDPTVIAESGGSGKSKTYRLDANNPFPPDWTRWLRSFETPEPNWSL